MSPDTSPFASTFSVTSVGEKDAASLITRINGLPPAASEDLVRLGTLRIYFDKSDDTGYQVVLKAHDGSLTALPQTGSGTDSLGASMRYFEHDFGKAHLFVQYQILENGEAVFLQSLERCADDLSQPYYDATGDTASIGGPTDSGLSILPDVAETTPAPINDNAPVDNPRTAPPATNNVPQLSSASDQPPADQVILPMPEPLPIPIDVLSAVGPAIPAPHAPLPVPVDDMHHDMLPDKPCTTTDLTDAAARPGPVAMDSDTDGDDDTQNNGDDLHDGDEQNQHDDHALPETGALLVPGPAGPGTGPAPETVPVLPAPPVPVPPVPVPQPLPPALQPGPVPEPVAPQPVLPGTQPAPVLPDPLAPPMSPAIPQPTASVPGQLPGSTIDGSGQGSSSTTGLDPAPTEVIQPGVDTHAANKSVSSSSSSSSNSSSGISYSSLFGPGKGGHGLIPSPSGPGLDLGTTIVGLGSGSLVAHSLFDRDGDAEMSFGDGGPHDHTSLPPDNATPPLPPDTIPIHEQPGDTIFHQPPNNGADDDPMDFDQSGDDQPGDHSDDDAPALDIRPTTPDTEIAPIVPAELGPDLFGAWLAAATAYNQAAPTYIQLQNEQLETARREVMNYQLINRAENEKQAMEGWVSREVTKIAANLEKIARINTINAANEEAIEQLQHRRGASHMAWTAAEERISLAETALEDALARINQTEEEAIKGTLANSIVAQGNIIHQQQIISDTQRGEMSYLDGILRFTAEQIRSGEQQIAGLSEANRLIDNQLLLARDYLADLDHYLSAINDSQRELDAQFFALEEGSRIPLTKILTDAVTVMNTLNAFRDPTMILIHVDDDPDWDQIYAYVGPLAPHDPALPQRPLGLPIGGDSSGTGASHTTTTSSTTLAPSEAQSGSHPAADPVSFNAVTDPAAGHDLVLQGDHGLNLQIDMAHPAAHPGSSDDVLHFAAVVNKLPVIAEIIQAWMHTLPASSGIAYAAVEVLEPQDDGPVTLAIRFALRSDQAAGANGELPAEAVAVLKSAIQGVAAVWEHEQEGARVHASVDAPAAAAPLPDDVVPPNSFSAPTPLPESAADHGNPDATVATQGENRLTPAHVPLHHGFDGPPSATSMIYIVEFAAPSGKGDDAVMAARSTDWQAIGTMLAHWMDDVDPGLADNIVAFEIEDWGADCGGVVLELLLNDSGATPPSAQATSALQQDVQAYLTAPDNHAEGLQLIGLGSSASTLLL